MGGDVCQLMSVVTVGVVRKYAKRKGLCRRRLPAEVCVPVDGCGCEEVCKRACFCSQEYNKGCKGDV